MLHSNIPLNDRHAPHNYEYADATAREAAVGFVNGDIGKLALQLDDYSYWVLSATTPAWVNVQTSLTSGTTIKTVNSASLLGAGDLTVQETLVSGTNIIFRGSFEFKFFHIFSEGARCADSAQDVGGRGIHP